MSYPAELNYSLKQRKVENRLGTGEILRSFFENVKQPNVLRIINMTAIHSAYLKAVLFALSNILRGLSLVFRFVF